MFRISVRKFTYHEYMTRITGTWHEDLCTFIIISRWILLRMRNILCRCHGEDQNRHFIFCNLFCRKSCRLWDNVEKLWYSQSGHRLQYNTAHAHCMLDNQGYKNWVCNTYCSSMAKMLTRTRLNITFFLVSVFFIPCSGTGILFDACVE